MNFKKTLATLSATALGLILWGAPLEVQALPPAQSELPIVFPYLAQAPKLPSAQKAGPKYKVDAQKLEEALGVIDTAVLLLKNEAREKAKPGKITNSAIDAMTLLLEDRKLKADFLKEIDADAPADLASKRLRSQFMAAAKRYPQLLNNQELTMAVLKGIMKASDDPYTTYLDPEEYKLLNEQMSGGNFGGIGIVMILSGSERDPLSERVLTINQVMDDSPSSRAGLAAKDEIIRIGSKATHGMTLPQCSKLLRGEPGSKVELTIRRPSSGATFKVTLEREVIHVESLKSEVLEKDGVKIGYIALGIFGESTNSEMEEAMRSLEFHGCQAYIIDVRNNSGGYVSAAVDVCSKFVPTGSRIVSIVDGANKEQIIYSRPSLRNSTEPLLVLMNDNSASASEITAGAIRDLKRGQLVGIKSFGKGSVQKIFPAQFPKGKVSAFKITTAHYHTPAGHDLHKAGLKPDVEVKMKPELILDQKKDTQLQKALEILAAQVKEEETKTQEQAPSEDGSLPVSSLFDEEEYLERAFKDKGGYQIVQRTTKLTEEGVVEHLTVTAGDGSKHQFQFKITP